MLAGRRDHPARRAPAYTRSSDSVPAADIARGRSAAAESVCLATLLRQRVS